MKPSKLGKSHKSVLRAINKTGIASAAFLEIESGLEQVYNRISEINSMDLGYRIERSGKFYRIVAVVD